MRHFRYDDDTPRVSLQMRTTLSSYPPFASYMYLEYLAMLLRVCSLQLDPQTQHISQDNYGWLLGPTRSKHAHFFPKLA
jgi:hypothetical protein